MCVCVHACVCVCVCVYVCVCDSCASLKAGSPKVKGKLGLTCSTHWGWGMHVQGLGVYGAAVWLLTTLITSQSQAPDAPLRMQIC